MMVTRHSRRSKVHLRRKQRQIRLINAPKAQQASQQMTHQSEQSKLVETLHSRTKAAPGGTIDPELTIDVHEPPLPFTTASKRLIQMAIAARGGTINKNLAKIQNLPSMSMNLHCRSRRQPNASSKSRRKTTKVAKQVNPSWLHYCP